MRLVQLFYAQVLQRAFGNADKEESLSCSLVACAASWVKLSSKRPYLVKAPSIAGLLRVFSSQRGKKTRGRSEGLYALQLPALRSLTQIK